jgi:hypothetical protein
MCAARSRSFQTAGADRDVRTAAEEDAAARPESCANGADIIIVLIKHVVVKLCF